MPTFHTHAHEKRSAAPDARLAALLAAASAAPLTAPSVNAARAALATLTHNFCPMPEPAAHWRDEVLIFNHAQHGDYLPLQADFGDNFRQNYPKQIKIRLYDPEPNNPNLPIALYLHGGGHLAGSIEVYHPICARLSQIANIRVMALDYRLAPENPWPYGIFDAMAALQILPKWLFEIGFKIKNKFTVIGDSAGGALTATLAAKIPEKIKQQILIYPSLDYLLQSPSVQENASGYLLEISRVRWYFEQYFGDKQNKNAQQASPLHMVWHQKPAPALIFTAGFCPLRDEAWDYAARLENSGSKCTLVHYPAMVHAFLNLYNLVPDICDDVYAKIGQFMRENL